MRKLNSSTALVLVTSSFLFIGCVSGGGGDGPEGSASSAVNGGVYTTFDGAQGGCKNSDNGINCNHYESKDDVYLSGGPLAAGLSDGSYYFAVLTPGSQNGGFADGASGNLSDMTAGKKGDLGSGDPSTNRTFTVSGHDIVAYSGTHATGTSPNGKLVIQVMPFDDTSNNGGVYILAVCEVGATSPSQCKYDAFKVSTKDDGGDGGAGGADCEDDDASCGGEGGAGGAPTEDGGAPSCCGDAVLDEGEGCDDGNTASGDGCSAECQVEAPEPPVEPCCGDAVVDPGESCDDGNTASGDGCSATCQIEAE